MLEGEEKHGVFISTNTETSVGRTQGRAEYKTDLTKRFNEITVFPLTPCDSMYTVVLILTEWGSTMHC